MSVELAKYVIDVNLPRIHGLWQRPDFIHMVEINRTWSDLKIWDFAKKNNLTIITKDRDYYNRIILEEPPPRVIHLRIGNMKLQDFRAFFFKNWPEIERLNALNKLVMVFDEEFVWVE